MQGTGDCDYYVWIDRKVTPYEQNFLYDPQDVVLQLSREKADDKEEIEMVQCKCCSCVCKGSAANDKGSVAFVSALL